MPLCLCVVGAPHAQLSVPSRGRDDSRRQHAHVDSHDKLGVVGPGALDGDDLGENRIAFDQSMDESMDESTDGSLDRMDDRCPRLTSSLGLSGLADLAMSHWHTVIS